MSGFEGSYLGQQERIDADTQLECGVCWWVYDPKKGDDVWQIPAGTAFNALPAHWRCPKCDAAQHQFMVIGERSGETVQTVAGSSHEVNGEAARLRDAYAKVDARMRGLPVYREGLPLGVLEMESTDAGLVTIAYTPWCMNIVLISADREQLVEGSSRDVALPSGVYPFIRGFLPDYGAIESCSLYSPMQDFADGESVIAVAAEVMQQLLTAETTSEVSSEAPTPADAETLENPSRRRLFTGSPTATLAGV
ncbi:MAG: [NiFe]-hydrogenase assembly chaperone HybE [Congregibacter sp.]